MSLIENDRTRVIDCSTAHRTHPDWAYGFPELSRIHKERIAQAKRVANPGCHATGFISIVYPLVSMGLLHARASTNSSIRAICFSTLSRAGPP